MVENKNGDSMLTDAEAELYDRQIRLWGLESQKRLRQAKVLVIGLNGFGAEVAKNIILAGVKSVTFMDHRLVTPEDSCAQFFVEHNDIGKNRAKASVARAQNLNSMVEVSADESNVDDKSNDYFRSFDVICASQCTITQLKLINRLCREYNAKFFAGDVWGLFAYTFADLKTHEYAMDITQSKKKPGDSTKSTETIVNTVKKTECFVPFENVLNETNFTKKTDSNVYHLFQIMMNYREKHGKDPEPSEREINPLKEEAKAIIEKYHLGDKLNHLIDGDLYAQVSPVCAIIGGVMGQEIIKAVSQKELPHNNLFLFNPDTMSGQIMKLGY